VVTIIKNFPLASYEGEKGKASMYLTVKTYSFDYVGMSRELYIGLMLDVESDEVFTLEGGFSPFSCLGVYTHLSGEKKVYKENNVLVGFVKNAASLNEFGNLVPLEFTFNHTCPTLGITAPQVFNVKLMLHPFYTAPVISMPTTAVLGNDVILSGEFLDTGYDVTARVLINGNTVSEQAITSENKYIQTDVEWIRPFINDKSIDASVEFSALYRGVPLPDILTLPIKLTLSAEEGAPTVTAEHSFLSDASAVQELGLAVKGKSRALIKLSEATGRLGASVESASIVFEGVAHSGDTFESEQLDIARTYNYQVRALDSRGFIGVYNGSFTVEDYAPPKFTATVKRTDYWGNENKRGDCLYLEASIDSFYSFSGENTCSLYFTSRKAGETNGSETRFSANEINVFELGLDAGSTYEIKVICRDTFEGETSKVFILEKENVELNIAKNKVGIGKYAESERVFECAWPIRCEGDVSVVTPEGAVVSLLSLESAVSVCDIPDEQTFTQLTTPDAGKAKLILMYLQESFFGYSKGYHLFFVFNHRGSGGNIEIKFT
jgi:hypothetical protein